MATLARIFIAVIMVMAALALGIAINEVSIRDQNPKNELMNVLRQRNVLKFDIARIVGDIKVQRGQNEDGELRDTIQQLVQQGQQTEQQIEVFDTQAAAIEESITDQLAQFDTVELEVSDFAATIKSYREAFNALQRQNAYMQDLYQDVTRRYESLAIEKIRMDIEYARILEDRRAIETAYLDAQAQAHELSDTIQMMLYNNPDLPAIANNVGDYVEGQVTAVDAGPVTVVTISVGRQDGVTRDQRYSVIGRDGTFKGRIRITRVDANASIGVVEEPFPGNLIQVGDQVYRSQLFLRPGSAPVNRAPAAGN